MDLICARKSPASTASLAKRAGIKASIRAVSKRERTGDAPPLEIAISNGERSISDGIIKLPAAGSLATLT